MASLATHVSDLATRIGTEFKTLRAEIVTLVGAKTSLTTTDKSNIVAAVNEINAALGGAGVSIDDSTTDVGKVWSSSKTNTAIGAAVTALIGGAPGALDTLDELAAALADNSDFAGSMTTLLAGKVPTTRTVAGKALSANITIAMGDLSDYATLIGNPDTDFAAVFTAALV